MSAITHQAIPGPSSFVISGAPQSSRARGDVELDYYQDSAATRPAPHLAILREIESSRAMLTLSENWDDNGARRIAADTLERATDFLLAAAAWTLAEFGNEIPVPRISPVPDGSVNLYWKNSMYELLVNFPPNETVANFFGTVGSEGLEGDICTSVREPYELARFFRLTA